MALHTSALNAEEQVSAQLPKSVAKGSNHRNTELQVTSDTAVQAKLKTMTVLAQAERSSSPRGSKSRR